MKIKNIIKTTAFAILIAMTLTLMVSCGNNNNDNNTNKTTGNGGDSMDNMFDPEDGKITDEDFSSESEKKDAKYDENGTGDNIDGEVSDIDSILGLVFADYRNMNGKMLPKLGSILHL